MDIFSGTLELLEARETYLGGNKYVNDATIEDATIKPLEIKTFVIKVKYM